MFYPTTLIINISPMKLLGQTPRTDQAHSKIFKELVLTDDWNHALNCMQDHAERLETEVNQAILQIEQLRAQMALANSGMLQLAAKMKGMH